ncbi:hypothetical protein RchiOBHm_Chr7g0214771 [Rosa chinensis]|uniref:Uncharacterized protein n=1 Tax=Rosa chinensis TaxID=74649 RepID=A0A2P6PBA8_ROSCH|nr:uncharacterized protein LOC112177992 [Rosa chinensis]PRQ19214.1 hypothetical protein RchiOBHm_Chr7g0214771 [Rosa chinensis]
MDFSHLSDSAEDSAVEDLLSQAKDHILLEQLSAINCSGFTDSVLPTDLESRFCRLKSFPVTKHNTTNSRPPQTTASFRHDSVQAENPDEKKVPNPKSQSGYESPPLESSEFSPEKGMTAAKPKPKHGSVSSRSNSSNSSPDSAIFSPAKRVSGKKQRSKSKLKSKSKSGWLSSPLGSCNSLRDDSPSPPRKAGCFWCSPKTKSASSQRKSKENGGIGGGLRLNFSDDDELLSDLGSFSKKEQSKMLKKAMKEEEKISREAEKVVKWAKQESARMNVTGIDDELSDD